MREFTLIMPFYENAAMFDRQLRHIAALPGDIKQHLHLIVCDDGSPGVTAEAVWYDDTLPVRPDLWIASFRMFRVDVDVRWNWLTCRNIGAHHAKTDWVLMTDIDHLLPEATARRVIEGPLDPSRAYRFSRVDAPDMKPTLDRHGNFKPHPNTWLMTKQLFDRIGGYDEVFSGAYGSDGEFRDRVKKHAGEPIILPEIMIRVPREVVPDASTTRYGRKEPRDRELVARARAVIAARKPGERPLRLSFPFHRVI